MNSRKDTIRRASEFRTIVKAGSSSRCGGAGLPVLVDFVVDRGRWRRPTVNNLFKVFWQRRLVLTDSR